VITCRTGSCTGGLNRRLWCYVDDESGRLHYLRLSAYASAEARLRGPTEAWRQQPPPQPGADTIVSFVGFWVDSTAVRRHEQVNGG